jgi:hypothetical protein
MRVLVVEDEVRPMDKAAFSLARRAGLRLVAALSAQSGVTLTQNPAPAW